VTKMEQAAKVVEFAKANGFPNASWFLWSVEGETSYDSTTTAIDELDDGEQEDFQLSAHLGDITLRQELSYEDNGETKYSNAVEVSP